jgi:hypothetical protein
MAHGAAQANRPAVMTPPSLDVNAHSRNGFADSLTVLLALLRSLGRQRMPEAARKRLLQRLRALPR